MGDVKHVNAEGSQILGATIENLVAVLTWHLGFVHPWISKGKGKGKGKVDHSTGHEGPDRE
jgi:hypothetical protein